MEVLQNIYRVDGVPVNMYLVFEFDGLTLIDTGFADSVERVVATVKTLGREMTDIKRIILTHRHIDHIGGAAALRKLTHAQVFAPQPDAAVISDDPKGAFPAPPLGTIMRLVAGAKLTPPPCQVDQILTDGMTLPVLGGLRVVATPGHTTGHVSLYHPGLHVLFAGDAAMTMGGKLRVSPAFLCDDYREACRTIRDRLAPLHIEHVLSGHGKPLQTNVPQHFERLVRRFGGM